MPFYCDLDQPKCASSLLLLLLPSFVIGLTEEKKSAMQRSNNIFLKMKKKISQWFEDWGKEYEQTQR